MRELAAFTVSIARGAIALRRFPYLHSATAKRPRAPVQARASSSQCEPPVSCRLYDVRGPCVPYHTAWEWQHALVNELKKNPAAPDALVLVEHEPTYTLGTASKLEHVLFDADLLRRGDDPPSAARSGAPLLVRTERGGEVTYHGPGQLVAYPILNLERHKRDLHWYLRQLEEVVIVMLRDHHGLVAERKEGLTGVWIADEKVCALGLKVSKWITMHGLALNIDTPLAPFQRIVPCGIADHGVTSLAALGGNGIVTMDAARTQLAESFCKVFGPYVLVDSNFSTDSVTTAAAVLSSGVAHTTV